MQFSHYLITFTLMVSLNVSASKPKDNPHRIYFTENLGQVNDQDHKTRTDILFSGSDGLLNFYLKWSGISYQLNRTNTWKEQEIGRGANLRIPDQQTIYRVDANFLNANPNPVIEKRGGISDYDNYYLPACPNGALNVKSFQSILYKKMYTGIDILWHERNGHLECDYLVAAGTDYKQIQLEIRGATTLSVNKKGELVISTPMGEIAESAPTVVQCGRSLPAAWTLKNNIAGFEISGLDAAQPYVIDPPIRVWGTYLGNESFSNACDTDPAGNVYITGAIVGTSSLIATTGAHQATMTGTGDIFVVKFNPSGGRIWGTFYSGNIGEIANTCATDFNGNIYICGYTISSSLIATPGSHQQLYGGGSRDGFIAKFSAAGVRRWGTYYGGVGLDEIRNCSTDKKGNLYISGETNSNGGTGIATPASHQSVFGGGDLDGFLAKFDSLGARQWGSYYGGSGTDRANSCVADTSGNIYLSGVSNSQESNAIATPGSHQPTLTTNFSYHDIFLAKFSASGTRQWGTFYGGEGEDYCVASCLDRHGNIFLTGDARSQNGIGTPGSFRPKPITGGSAFLAKFNSAGTLLWGTYFAVYSASSSYFCDADSAGQVYFGGFTLNDSVATPGSFQTVPASLNGDAFLARFDGSGAWQWGTYYGAKDVDSGRSGAVDNFGNVYMCGITQSNYDSLLATPGCYQDHFGGGPYNAFLVKFKDTGSALSLAKNSIPENNVWATIYPNPGGGAFNILVEPSLYGHATVEVFNSLQQRLFSERINSKLTSLDMTKYPVGLYYVLVSNGSDRVSLKVIKQ